MKKNMIKALHGASEGQLAEIFNNIPVRLDAKYAKAVDKDTITLEASPEGDKKTKFEVTIRRVGSKFVWSGVVKIVTKPFGLVKYPINREFSSLKELSNTYEISLSLLETAWQTLTSGLSRSLKFVPVTVNGRKGKVIKSLSHSGSLVSTM